MLTLVPHGAAPVSAVAGVLALTLACRAGYAETLARLAAPAAIFGALLAWGALSAAWSIHPLRSLVMTARLAGLFAAILALAAASLAVAPRRAIVCLLFGTAAALALGMTDLATGGMLSRLVTVRPFAVVRLNQLSAWLAILAMPVGALLFCRGRRAAGLVCALMMAGSVFVLDDTTAKIGVGLSLPVAAAMYLRRAAAARVGAALLALFVLTAPLTLPRLAQLPGAFAAADSVKSSGGHRLLIWSFTGDRIAERPFLGWGLDAARAIPGGKDEIRPGQTWLPLHTHDAALQVWLELGAPGAALLAIQLGWLALRLGSVDWPPVFAAAAGAGFAAATVIALAGWGIWQEWWLGTLAIAAFSIILLGRAARDANG